MNIKYAIVKNEMPASSTEAKYLGQAIPNGVRNRTQMTALALKNEHFAEATFGAVIDAVISLTQELCAEGRDVDWGPVKFLAKMHGSLPYEDSAFTDGTASLTLDADATNATRDTLATLDPVKVSAAEFAQSIKVSNIMDVATEQFGTVVGATEFYVLGNGITLDGEGEYVKAYDKKTGVLAGTAQVISVSKGQRAKCKFNPQLAGGDYILEIATKGLIGETTPRVFRKAVTAIAVPEPTPIDQTPDGKVKVYSATDDGQSETFTYGHTWLVNGAGMFVGLEENGWRIQDVKAVANESHEPELSWTTSADGKTLTLTKNGSAMPVPAGSYPSAKIKVTLAKDAAGSETYALQIPINLVVPE